MKILSFLALFLSAVLSAQNIENQETLTPFIQKLKENKSVSNILFLGDSHIQSDWLTAVLRKNFQARYGNAGRGLVFPHSIANSNGAEDFSAISNQTWEIFRLVHQQDIFSQIGALGFVIGNKKPSFIQIEFKNPEDNFDKIIIFNDLSMNNEKINFYSSSEKLQNFITKNTEKIRYQVQEGETFHELASKFYTTTTKLKALNGAGIQNPKIGNWIQTEQTKIIYNQDFEKTLKLLKSVHYNNLKTTIELPNSTHFLMESNTEKGNILYGFQFLKNVDKGLVFNSVGVNGATYADFTKYPLQMAQLNSLEIDMVMIALGTNEAMGSITEQELSLNAEKLIQDLRKNKPNLPIVLIAPTDNKLRPQKVKEIAVWIKNIAQKNNTAYFNLHEAMGGLGYFSRALQRKEANTDGIHFLKTGYEKQAQTIWNAFEKILE